jgi:hypothetical protein
MTTYIAMWRKLGVLRTAHNCNNDSEKYQ